MRLGGGTAHPCLPANPPARPPPHRAHLPPPGADTLVLRCGPGPMNKALEAHLDALGYPTTQQFQF
jgi:ferredoxin-NADP reductase